jgi:hypothetical protein
MRHAIVTRSAETRRGSVELGASAPSGVERGPARSDGGRPECSAYRTEGRTVPPIALPRGLVLIGEFDAFVDFGDGDFDADFGHTEDIFSGQNSGFPDLIGRLPVEDHQTDPG